MTTIIPFSHVSFLSASSSSHPTLFPPHQDRIYPELQRLLGQQDSRVVVGRDAQWEHILARAACLRDICRERSGAGPGGEWCFLLRDAIRV